MFPLPRQTGISASSLVRPLVFRGLNHAAKNLLYRACRTLTIFCTAEKGDNSLF
jgi:hypothetical protein